MTGSERETKPKPSSKMTTELARILPKIWWLQSASEGGLAQQEEDELNNLYARRSEIVIDAVIAKRDNSLPHDIRVERGVGQYENSVVLTADNPRKDSLPYAVKLDISKVRRPGIIETNEAVSLILAGAQSINFLDGAEQTVWQENNKGRRIHLPVTMKPKTQSFWRDVIKSDGYNNLDPHEKDLILVYFFTDSSTTDLSKKLDPPSPIPTLSSHLRSIMEKMRRNLPIRDKLKYTPSDVRLLKDRKKLQALPSYHKRHVERVNRGAIGRFNRASESSSYDLSLVFRKAQPERAAAFNIKYVNGREFPQETRKAYVGNPDLYAEWKTETKGNSSRIIYREGNFYHESDDSLTPLTPDSFTEIYLESTKKTRIHRDYLLRFARSSKAELRQKIIDAVKLPSLPTPQIKNGANGNGEEK